MNTFNKIRLIWLLPAIILHELMHIIAALITFTPIHSIGVKRESKSTTFFVTTMSPIRPASRRTKIRRLRAAKIVALAPTAIPFLWAGFYWFNLTAEIMGSSLTILISCYHLFTFNVCLPSEQDWSNYVLFNSLLKDRENL